MSDDTQGLNEDQIDDVVEDQEIDEIEYDYREVTDDHEALFRELTESPNESLADPEPEPEEEEEPETEPEAETEEASQEDQEKANQAVEQIGNKNYIDQDLINSIEDKDLRQKVWNLANTAQSHYNRVYAKEQEVSKLRNEIATLQAQQQVAMQNTQSKAEEKAVDEATQRKISRLKEDYPDLADSIEAMFQTKISEHSEQLRELFDKEYSPIREKIAEESRQSEVNTLEQAANDIFRTDQTGVNYRDVVASPDFQTWLEQQDQSIKQLANSDRAAEVISVLKNYEYDYSRQFEKVNGQSWVEYVVSQREQAKKPQSSTNTPNDPASTAKGDQIKQQREKRLKTAVTGVKPSRHASNSGASLDSDSLFNHFAKQSRYNSR
jgi:hypothetical protein